MLTPLAEILRRADERTILDAMERMKTMAKEQKEETEKLTAELSKELPTASDLEDLKEPEAMVSDSDYADDRFNHVIELADVSQKEQLEVLRDKMNQLTNEQQRLEKRAAIIFGELKTIMNIRTELAVRILRMTMTLEDK